MTSPPPGQPPRTERTVTPAELVGAATDLLDDGHRLALVSGHDDGARLRAVYLFTGPAGKRTELHVPVDRDHPHVPTLAGVCLAAGRFEREMHDLFGVVPDGHPPPHRLVRHSGWPKGWHPMRRDAGPPPEFGDTEGPFPFHGVEGPGVNEIPVGPVHAGLTEPGHFRFSVAGETILKLEARLWFVHKGIERLFDGRRPSEGIELAERISGDTAVGHTLAFCLATEDALGITVAPGAHRVRAILCELERLYNHSTDIGALCDEAGHGVLNAQAQRVRERLLRVNDTVTGHRLLRGAVYPGGATVRHLPGPDELTEIAADLAEIVDLALNHSAVADRFAGTAVLTREQAADLGTVGYVARASGVPADDHHDHPAGGAGPLRTEHRHTDGDVLSRFCVRADEIQASVGRIAELLSDLDIHDLPLSARPAEPARPSSGVGIVDGWRGTIAHRVELTPDGTLSRVKIVDPSFVNWPALPVALADTLVPDFPLATRSFNLSHAGNDL